MKSLEIRGAGEEVTGSQFLLTGKNGSQFLIDCGMVQGYSEGGPQNADLDPTNLKGILITHAHLDHVGLVQKLAKYKDVPVYMTPSTLSISDISLRNSARISPKLFPPGSIEEIFRRTITVPYDKQIGVDGAKVTFRDAGHILGSASIEINEGGEIIVFSGDIGNSPSRTVRPTQYINEADIVVMESTYGGKERSEQDPVEDIKEAINLVRKNRGTLLIPSFAIDRTQSVLSILKKLSQERFLNGICVNLDSPMASDVTRVYQNSRDLLNEELSQLERPFSFQELRETYTFKDSLSIDNQRNPKIIVAGSGMITGGRIIRHAQRYLPYDNNVILFVGYPAPGTPSELIARGDKVVILDGEEIPVNAQVLQTSLSAHADKNGLLSWLEYPYLGQRNLRETVIVHGENENRYALREAINERFGINAIVPNRGDLITFN